MMRPRELGRECAAPALCARHRSAMRSGISPVAMNRASLASNTATSRGSSSAAASSVGQVDCPHPHVPTAASIR